MSASITIPLDPGTKAQLLELSKQMNCTEAELVQRALRDFLSVEAWQGRAIDEGLAAADRGHLLDHETLKAQWATKLGLPLE